MNQAIAGGQHGERKQTTKEIIDTLLMMEQLKLYLNGLSNSELEKRQ